jgi:hypothetical protein
VKPSPAKKPSFVDKLDDDILYDFMLADKDMRSYLEFKKLEYCQATLRAAMRAWLRDCIHQDTAYQEFLKPNNGHLTT